MTTIVTGQVIVCTQMILTRARSWCQNHKRQVLRHSLFQGLKGENIINIFHFQYSPHLNDRSAGDSDGRSDQSGRYVSHAVCLLSLEPLGLKIVYHQFERGVIVRDYRSCSAEMFTNVKHTVTLELAKPQLECGSTYSVVKALYVRSKTPPSASKRTSPSLRSMYTRLRLSASAMALYVFIVFLSRYRSNRKIGVGQQCLPKSSDGQHYRRLA